MALGMFQGFRNLRCLTQEVAVSWFDVSKGILRKSSVGALQNRDLHSTIFSSEILHGTFPRRISCGGEDYLRWNTHNIYLLRTTMLGSLSADYNRFMSTKIKAPPQIRQPASMKVVLLSPGFVYDPYKPREPISFWRRWFTRSGWRRTKEDCLLELKNAYAVAKLRKIAGYSKPQFYKEALQLYKEINTLMAKGDKTSLRKAVTENMYSTLKNEIKQRASMWSSVYWELIEPAEKIRTLRARMIGVDKNDLDKAFVQLTLEFLTKQKFEAYNLDGSVISGDKEKEVLVRDIWVFERSLFHPGAYWRLCGRISL